MQRKLAAGFGVGVGRATGAASAVNFRGFYWVGAVEERMVVSYRLQEESVVLLEDGLSGEVGPERAR